MLADRHEAHASVHVIAHAESAQDSGDAAALDAFPERGPRKRLAETAPPIFGQRRHAADCRNAVGQVKHRRGHRFAVTEPHQIRHVRIGDIAGWKSKHVSHLGWDAECDVDDLTENANAGSISYALNRQAGGQSRRSWNV